MPAPVTIDDATIAAQSGTGAATTTAPAQLSFCATAGRPSGCGIHTVTIPAGGDVYSDAATFPDTTTGSGNLAVSIHLPTAISTAPVHTAGNTTNYLASGDTTANQDGAPYTTSFTDGYFLTAVDVSTADPGQGTIVVLGDQTSAKGAPGGTYQSTWVDDLPAKLGANLPGSLVNASLAGSQTTAWWRAAETGAAFNQSILGEPNIRTVIVALGAQDILQNVAPADTEQNLTALMKSITSAYCIKNFQRADGSAIHIVLATVPPLGLAPTDQRELNRQELNSAIRNNFVSMGADDIVDFDQAVRDSANPNTLSPLYLTDGVPNATYYNTIAQTLTDAVETFPPTAQL
ncbi:MAG TPA: GDSL-type esterase/lipase family protein [Mycobacteriales bacterium]